MNTRLWKNILWVMPVLVWGISDIFALDVVVDAGKSARDNCPISVSLKGAQLPDGIGVGKEVKLSAGDQEVPAMILEGPNGPELAFILNALPAGTQRVYHLVPGKAKTENPVTISQKENTLDIQIGDHSFTTYVFAGDKLVQPYFYPVFGPKGARMTRGYPMDPREGEARDHPHHHSLWVAHGDLNGSDNWSVGKGHGFTRQTQLKSVVSGPVCGQFSTVNDWTTGDGKIILEDHRTLTIWGTPEQGRMIDFDLTFLATEGDVKFGDTKEGGLVSLRVAETLTENAKKGGIITNANGATTMSNTWGKQAPWCDYSGPVDNTEVGLSILDYPSNPFFPTYYHVRDYGLFTANPFGLSAFKNDKKVDGSRILKKNESWHCRYRIYIHAGDVKTGKVAEAYENFADAPKTTIR